MYQRLAMPDRVSEFVYFVRLADRQHELHEERDELVGSEEEQARQRHHPQHHDGRDQRFVSRGPGDLAGFLAHFLNEFQWIGASHGTLSAWGTRPITNSRASHPGRPKNWVSSELARSLQAPGPIP